MSLQKYILRRILTSVPVLFGVSVITFALMHAAPGDVVSQMIAANPNVTSAEAVRLREEYGDRVPYVFVDGWPAFKYRVDESELRRQLRTE